VGAPHNGAASSRRGVGNCPKGQAKRAKTGWKTMSTENLNLSSNTGGASAQSLSAPQNGESGSTYCFSFQASDGEVVDTSPIYRLVVDVSYGSSVGALQRGFYVKVNNSVYFVVKKAIDVKTVDEAEKVFAFLAKTKLPFTISVRHDETLSAHQVVSLYDVSVDTEFYSVREFKVFRSLWRDIEYEIFEYKYSPAMTRFTSDKLDWYVKLMPEYSLKFKQVSSISATYITSQGHLDVFKIISDDPYAFPDYLYSRRRKLTFFNHVIEGDSNVIPLGPEIRIVNLSRETNITSPDHETILLYAGEYLLVHPRPKRDEVD